MSYKNILLIDDDSDDADLFIEAVDSLQKEIVCRFSSNALKAFQELQTLEALPDLIFIDFNMPCLNGAEFIQKMKSESRLQHISIILMSTHTVEVMQQITHDLDVHHYITKPSSFNELVALLEGIL